MTEIGVFSSMEVKEIASFFEQYKPFIKKNVVDYVRKNLVYDTQATDSKIYNVNFVEVIDIPCDTDSNNIKVKASVTPIQNIGNVSFSNGYWVKALFNIYFVLDNRYIMPFMPVEPKELLFRFKDSLWGRSYDCLFDVEETVQDFLDKLTQYFDDIND
jgi:hypothetical protein